MGRVHVPVRVSNVVDGYLASEGHVRPEAVRAIDIPGIAVDTGASTLCLPARLVRELGLTPGPERRVRTGNGVRVCQQYGVARVELMDCF